MVDTLNIRCKKCGSKLTMEEFYESDDIESVCNNCREIYAGEDFSQKEICKECGNTLSIDNYYNYAKRNDICNICMNRLSKERYKINGYRRSAKHLIKRKDNSPWEEQKWKYPSEGKGHTLDVPCGRSMIYVYGYKKQELIDAGIPENDITNKKVGWGKYLFKIKLFYLRNLGYSEEKYEIVKKYKFSI